jgi:hypothetical protein
MLLLIVFRTKYTRKEDLSVIDYSAIRELKENYLLTLLDDGKQINKNLTFVLTGGKSIKISELITEEGVYFLYLQGGSCSPCYKEELSETTRLLDSMHVNFRIVTSFPDTNVIVDIQEELKKDILMLNNNYLGLQAERDRSVFIFNISKEFIISKLFFFDTTSTDMKIKYLKMISNK